jgi:hypothetical protein
MRKYLIIGGIAALGLAAFAGPHALKAASAVINETVAIVDPYSPQQQMRVNSDGSINITPAGGGVFGSIVDFSFAIQVTGTPVQLPSNALKNGLTCYAVSLSGGKVSISQSATPSNPQSVAFSNSAVGTYLVGGQGWSAAINNSNIEYINGTAGDGVQCWGN